MILKIALPILFTLGILTNIANFYVFTRRALKKFSTFHMLAYLSAIDFLFVLTGMTHMFFIVYYNYDYRRYGEFMCSFHSFLTMYLSHLSSNIQAAVGVLRCLKMGSRRCKKSITAKNTRIYSLAYWGKVNILVFIIAVSLLIIDGHYLIWMRLHVANSSIINYSFLNPFYL
jgi:hypothetical protein